MREMRIFTAEAVGTAILMLGGPGTAVYAFDAHGGINGTGVLAVSLGFGLALMIIAYAIGPISGGHVNPAVTLGMALMKKIETRTIPAYLGGQIVGALVGALILWVTLQGRDGWSVGGGDGVQAGDFATNGWTGGFFGFGPMAITEVVFTALLIFVVLSTTRDGFSPGAVGLHVGMALALIHIVTIPVDNTSVNPVRSFGMAVFAGGEALEQLWAFIVFPLIGAALGVLIWLAVDDASLEDTTLADGPMTSVRDATSKATGLVEEAVEKMGDRLE